jgi:hypothetical protein
MTAKIYHPEKKHPPEYQQDLNPDAQQGINYGAVGPHPELQQPPTAYNVKEAHRQLSDFPDDVLKQIPILPEGSRLEEGAVYLDLKDPKRKEFTGRGNMVATPGHWYVPKSVVDYGLWNKLTGVTNPQRTGER